MLFAISCWTVVRVFVGASATVALENVALRYHLMVLQRSVSRPRLRQRDRIFFSEAVCQEHCSRLISAPSISAPS